MSTSQFVPAEVALRWACGAAVVVVLAMLGIFITTGVGQDPLQFMHPPEEYAAILLKNPTALLATLALDDLFIALYSTVFIALAITLHRSGAPKLFLAISIAAMLALALLDLAENMHFLVMLRRAQLGLAPSSTEIGAQVFESLVKFHVSYVGLFLLGFALPRRTPSERALAAMSWFVQLPVGVLIYVAPPAIATPLVLVRFAYFVSALAILGSSVRPASSVAGLGAPA